MGDSITASIGTRANEDERLSATNLNDEALPSELVRFWTVSGCNAFAAGPVSQGNLSVEGEALLVYLENRGGEGPQLVDDGVAFEAVRAGLIEVVSTGLPEPVLVLTAAGRAYCHTRSEARGGNVRNACASRFERETEPTKDH